MNLLTAQLLVNIIKQQMNLPNASVWLRDQNAVIPNDDGLYIIVGLVSAFTAANVTRMEEETIVGGTVEHQISQLQQQENIQVDIISRSNAALTRNWEVIAAMQSIYAQQMQEKYNFKIFRIPRSFVNTSHAEGGSQLNRYTIVIPCLVWYQKDTLLTSPLGDYFDDFTAVVQDEQSIETDMPLIEFEIDPNTPPPFNNEA